MLKRELSSDQKITRIIILVWHPLQVK